MSHSDQQWNQTFFASAGRVAGLDLIKQAEATLVDPCVQVILEAVQGHLLILNSSRQILAANAEVLDALERETPGCIIGLRPGEAFNCIHFTEGPEGCGTSRHCRACGAVLATLAAQSTQKRSTDECRLSLLKNGQLVAVEYRVTASPLKVKDQTLTALVLTDITSEKRREVLEQTFLHDVMNSLGGLEGWGRLLQELDGSAAARKMLGLAEILRSEVLCHRALLAAEQGVLTVNQEQCSVSSILKSLGEVFSCHPVRAQKDLKIALPAQDITLRTDQALVSRVLCNMAKNALEATPPGGTASLLFEFRQGRPAFVVENTGTMSEEVQLRVFERSFSTKAAKGRGLGTYSMKLFGERFLKGEVSFECKDGKTRFWISLPRESCVQAAPAPPQALKVVQPAPQTQSANPAYRVLFVEDDDSISRLGKLFLERIGCKVTVCKEGEEADACFASSPDAFDVVLTDANLPGMSGSALCRKIRKLRPDIPVLLASGGPAVPENELKAAGFSGALQKPFSISTLSEALKKAIAG